MENLSDNIKILKSQANCTLDDDMAISLLAKFDNDVVSAILEADGELSNIPKVTTKKKLNPVQAKIAELRDIVDRKDQLMDKLLSDSREKTTKSTT